MRRFIGLLYVQRLSLWIVTAMMTLPCGLLAQGSTTQLRVHIKDPSGAVITNAEVKLEDPAKNAERNQRSDNSGDAIFRELAPGRYRVAVSAEGFASSRLDDVVVLVNTPANLEVTLNVGTSGATVNVTAETTTVNVDDASLGHPFGSEQIQSIPAEGRNAVELLSLQAGVTYLGTNTDAASDSRGGAVNGARSDQTNITVDGLENNDQLSGQAFTGVLRIPMDSLEEFRVTTTSANADAGRSSGAQVALVTKSGTNAFHGSVYEYNRTLFGAANDWFNKRAEIEEGLPNKPGQLIRNTFGAAVGGPILKNRIFFFANYEGQRSREAVQVTQGVPSADLRNGIVHYLYGCDANGNNCQVQSLSPSDIQALDQGCLSSGTCPAGNGVSAGVLQLWNGHAQLPNGNTIPAYPMPNSSCPNCDGLNIQGFTFAGSQPQDLNTYLAKLDFNLTANGNHRVFLRGNLQGDRLDYAPQFPGQPPRSVLHTNNKGIAAGYTAVLSNTLVNNFRYGLVRAGVGNSGQNPYSYVGFWNIADQVSFAPTTNVNVPVHQITDDVSWTHGRHSLQFGGTWRLVFDNRYSNAQNFLYGSVHPTWLAYGGIANTGQDLDPAIGGFPAVDPNFSFSYDAAIANLAGLVGSISAYYDQDKNGRAIPTAALVPRHFKSNEAEFYVQDSWRLTSNLQLTYGLRYTLLQPPYETDGNQVSPLPGLGNFLDRRAAAMQLGQTYHPDLSFVLSGQANDKQPFWNWDYKNVAPRIAAAYSPSASSGWLHSLFGDHGKSSIRGGYGIYFDHFGEGIVNSFDREGSLGLTNYLENPSGISTTDCVVRFVALTTIPGTNGCPLSSGGPPVPELSPRTFVQFPYVPPSDAFAIGWGIDSGLKTPYAHVANLTFSRELKHDFAMEFSYVGRFGRRLLQEVDMAQPENIRDPKSGMTYYQAATLLVKYANANIPENKIPNIPYWQDLFPNAGGPAGISGYAPGIPANPTATQNIYDLYYSEGVNGTYALQYLDTSCFPACSTLGPYAYWDQQFSSLFSWRSTGHSNYNGFLATLRHRAGNVQFDLNYTFSKSLDANSNAERINEFENGAGTAVSYSGQVVNAWMPNQLYGPSDFDLRHQINGNWTITLPVGRGQHFGSAWNRFCDAAFGGWETSGLVRWTSGFPFSISTYAFPTNYEQDSKAVLLGAAPRTGVYIDSNGNPDVFAQGPAAASAFRYAYPGESGQRDNLRGPGYFDVDASLSKQWKIDESKSLRFTWDVFNVTNSVRFDVGTLSNYLLYQPSLGEFAQTTTKPRVMQFGLRFVF